MIHEPVLIAGAPRSGTSLVQKILRNHPAFWSMPSESEIIWDEFCHPKLRGWDSEYMDETLATAAIRQAILDRFEGLVWPAQAFGPMERTNLIWGFRRIAPLRKLMRLAYEYLGPQLRKLLAGTDTKRIVEKTVSNSLRFGFVNEIFPDARIIYPVRDGRNSINSLMQGWRDPTRFFSYDLPVPLDIAGYAHTRWNFVLPPGWRNYTHRPLEEVCAFQWNACNEAMLAETAKPKYTGRVMLLHLEELRDHPQRKIAELAEFTSLPYDDYFRAVADELPIVNSPDNDTSTDKWQGPNRAAIERVVPMIAPTMERLGYQV